MSGYRADAGDRYKCPDCNSTTGMQQIEGSIWVLTVFHDDSCPWLASRRAEPCS